MSTDAYAYEPVDNSPYLKLKGRGDVVKIRLVSNPIHFTEVFTKDDGSEEEGERFAWTVLDRATGKVKAFKAGVMIYKKIKDLALNVEWGDPTQYDLTITRTEEKGNFYTVVPSPNKSPITDEEKKTIESEGLDLERLFKTTDKGTTTFGKPQEDKDDEEINLDKIPF